MSKRQETEAPEKLESYQIKDLKAWYSESVKKGDLPQCTVDDLRRMVEACFRYHRSRGIKRVSWYATVQNWVIKQAEIDGFRPKKTRRPKPKHRAGAQSSLFAEKEYEPPDLDQIEKAWSLRGK